VSGRKQTTCTGSLRSACIPGGSSCSSPLFVFVWHSAASLLADLTSHSAMRATCRTDYQGRTSTCYKLISATKGVLMLIRLQQELSHDHFRLVLCRIGSSGPLRFVIIDLEDACPILVSIAECIVRERRGFYPLPSPLCPCGILEPNRDPEIRTPNP